MHELPFRLIVAIAALGQEFYGLLTIKKLIYDRQMSLSVFTQIQSVPDFQTGRAFSLLLYPYLSLISHTLGVFVYNLILFIYIDTSPYVNLRRAKRVLENVVIISWIPGVSNSVTLIVSLLYYQSCLFFYPQYLKDMLHQFIDRPESASKNIFQLRTGRSVAFLATFIGTFFNYHLECTTKKMPWYGIDSKVKIYKSMLDNRSIQDRELLYNYSSCVETRITHDLTHGVIVETANNFLILFAFIFHISFVTTTIKYLQYLSQQSQYTHEKYNFPHKRLSEELFSKIFSRCEELTTKKENPSKMSRWNRTETFVDDDNVDDDISQTWNSMKPTTINIIEWLSGNKSESTCPRNIYRTDSEPSIAFYSTKSSNEKEEVAVKSKMVLYTQRASKRLQDFFFKRDNREFTGRPSAQLDSRISHI